METTLHVGLLLLEESLSAKYFKREEVLFLKPANKLM